MVIKAIRRISSETIIIVCSALIAVFAWSKIGGQIFPVVDSVIITDMYAAGDADADGYYVSGTLTTRRNCEFVGVRWYQGKRDGRAYEVVVEPSSDNPITGNSWGPWFIKMSAINLDSNSYANIWHRCRLFGLPFPWLTENKFITNNRSPLYREQGILGAK